MTSCPEALKILEFEKKNSWDLNSERESWDLGLDEASRFSELAEARPVVCGGGAARGGLRWKSRHRNKLCLSLLMSKNHRLKKVIKSFVPEPKKRVVSVSCFSDSYVFEHLWTFSVSVWICLFHVIVSWSYIFGRGYATGASLLNTQHYKVRIKSKWSNSGKGVIYAFHQAGFDTGSFL